MSYLAFLFISWNGRLLNTHVGCNCGISSWPEVGALAFRVPWVVGLVLSQVSSKGYRCWTARSKWLLPAPNLATLTTPSRPAISSSTIPSFHLLRLRSSDFMIVTSLTCNDSCFVLCFMLCLSRSPLRYSLVHLPHRRSWHRHKYLARLLSSCSSRF